MQNENSVADTVNPVSLYIRGILAHGTERNINGLLVHADNGRRQKQDAVDHRLYLPRDYPELSIVIRSAGRLGHRFAVYFRPSFHA